MVQGTGSELSFPRLEFCLFPMHTLTFLSSYWVSLILSFLLIKYLLSLIALSHGTVVKIKLDLSCKMQNTGLIQMKCIDKCQIILIYYNFKSSSPFYILVPRKTHCLFFPPSLNSVSFTSFCICSYSGVQTQKKRKKIL